MVNANYVIQGCCRSVVGFWSTLMTIGYAYPGNLGRQRAFCERKMNTARDS